MDLRKVRVGFGLTYHGHNCCRCRGTLALGRDSGDETLHLDASVMLVVSRRVTLDSLAIVQACERHGFAS